MHNILKVIKNMLSPSKNCDHRFEPKDVANINLDQLCCYCKAPLSVLSNVDSINISGTIKCTIRTPQFKNGEVDRFHQQEGIIDTKTFLFTPDSTVWNGNHEVQFQSLEHAISAMI